MGKYDDDDDVEVRGGSLFTGGYNIRTNKALTRSEAVIQYQPFSRFGGQKMLPLYVIMISTTGRIGVFGHGKRAAPKVECWARTVAAPTNITGTRCMTRSAT